MVHRTTVAPSGSSVITEPSMTWQPVETAPADLEQARLRYIANQPLYSRKELEMQIDLQRRRLDRAANNHYPLVKALLRLDTLFDFSDEDIGKVWEFDDLSEIQSAFKEARAALSAAKGET